MNVFPSRPLRAACQSLAWLGVVLAGSAWGQAALTAEQMVEQLKAAPAAVAPAPAARTRGLTRNLAVEAAVPGAPAAEATSSASPVVAPVKPSLSLLIQFDFNSARVKAESQQSLANLAKALQSDALARSRFAIEGHTDAKGGADYNLKLSQQRAEAVREFLGGRGVATERLVASGKGSTELANSGDPFAAENRRVRIVNLD